MSSLASSGVLVVIPVLGSVTHISERCGVPSLKIRRCAIRGRLYNRRVRFAIECWMREDRRVRSNCLHNDRREDAVALTCFAHPSKDVNVSLLWYVI